jgi:hypothetical protein
VLAKPQTKGPGRTVQFEKRKQKRNPRRLLESVQGDWDRWDEAAALEGVNWSEFCRRALEARTQQFRAKSNGGKK